MKLVTAAVCGSDAQKLADELISEGVFFSRSPSRTAYDDCAETFMICCRTDAVDNIVMMIARCCRTRENESGGKTGGAVVFVTDTERFEKL